MSSPAAAYGAAFSRLVPVANGWTRALTTGIISEYSGRVRGAHMQRLQGRSARRSSVLHLTRQLSVPLLIGSAIDRLVCLTALQRCGAA